MTDVFSQGPIGNSKGGSAFDDSDTAGSDSLQSVTIYWDDNTIRGLELQYSSAGTITHGNTGGSFKSAVVEVGSSNPLVTIAGTYGYFDGKDSDPDSWMRVLTLSLNGSDYYGAPNSTGVDFSFQAMSGFCFNGFVGRSGKDLDAIGGLMIAQD